MQGITVLSIHDRIACFHSLKAFLFAKDNSRFAFTDSPEWCLGRDRNKVLVMVRRFIKPDIVDLELMKRLRAKYERIAFFHDDAGGGIPRLEVLPWVDLFYSKALFKDRSLYSRPLYGKELYSDYYHAKYGVDVIKFMASGGVLSHGDSVGGQQPPEAFRRRGHRPLQLAARQTENRTCKSNHHPGRLLVAATQDESEFQHPRYARSASGPRPHGQLPAPRRQIDRTPKGPPLL